MAADFQEYKGKQKPINSTHKFPLLRLLLIAEAAFFVYWSGLVTKIADTLSQIGNESEPAELSWDEKCLAYGGTSFNLERGLGQCSWVIDDSTEVSRLPNSFLRYVSQLRHSSKSKLHWIASRKNFSDASLVVHDDSTQSIFLRYMKPDSSFVWINKATGCRYPGVCPRQPLKWSALPITEDFDFEGQESLLGMDVFRGIGEAPVHPVLSGKVLGTGKDSLGYFVDIDHGYNVMSRTSGLGSLNDEVKVGSEVFFETRLGSLPPQDSATFFLTVRQNGLFVRWTDFYEATHPVQDEHIRAFVKSLGF